MYIQNNDSINVRNVMMSLDKFPVINRRIILKEALEEMGKFRLGIACIIGEDSALLGILTDGDIRRNLLSVQKPFSAFFVDDAIDHAILEPTVVSPDMSLKEAVILMGEMQIWDLPVVEENSKLVGLLHLHPAIQALLGIPK